MADLSLKPEEITLFFAKKTFGQDVRAFRKKGKMGHIEFGRKCGVNPFTLRRLERGDNVSAGAIAKVCYFTNIDIRIYVTENDVQEVLPLR